MPSEENIEIYRQLNGGKIDEDLNCRIELSRARESKTKVQASTPWDPFVALRRDNDRWWR
jgi:hypothetical protein